MFIHLSNQKMGDARQLMVQLPGFVVMVILLIEFIQKKPGLAGKMV
jgi:hypothetical protein